MNKKLLVLLYLIGMVSADSVGIMVLNPNGNKYAYCEKNKPCIFLENENYTVKPIKNMNLPYFEIIGFSLLLISIAVFICYVAVITTGKKFKVIK